MGNTFGTHFRLTTFGESHGPAIGGVIDGVPPRFPLDIDSVQQMLSRRAPGGGGMATTRREPDTVRFLSGISPEGLTLGTTIGFVIENTNARSADYEAMRHVYRPSHADYTYQVKYGIRDHRGGGRASARETACRVVGGGVAVQLLAARGVTVAASVERIGSLPMPASGQQVQAYADTLRRNGDTVGSVVSCTVTGVPAGLGSPVFDKLQARLAAAMMSIPGARAFEYGDGIEAATMLGSQANDPFIPAPDGGITLASNHSGGIQGGISNGMPIEMRITFKPIATIMQPQHTVDSAGQPCVLQPRGRHDISIGPRAVPVVESMAAMVILDAWMEQDLTRSPWR